MQEAKYIFLYFLETNLKLSNPETVWLKLGLIQALCAWHWQINPLNPNGNYMYHLL
jgi:hypothetical protein